MPAFVVRPSGQASEPFRIGLTAVSLLSLKLKPGDICELRKTDDDDNRLQEGKRLAVAWEASGAGIKDSVVQTSKLLQEVYGFKLGDKITISRSTESIQNTKQILLRSCEGFIDQRDVPFWERVAEIWFSGENEYLVMNQKIQLKVAEEPMEFLVKDIGIADARIARVTKDTKLRIATNEAAQAVKIDFQPKRLGGVDSQIEQIRDLVRRVCKPVLEKQWKLYQPRQGVLVYGATGTGKTTFITALSESGWSNVIQWKSGTKIRITAEPQLITVHHSDLSPSTTRELQDLFRQIRNTPTMVVAEVQHPNNIDQSLRTESAFAREIELPTPSAHQRKEILLALRGDDTVWDDELLEEMAYRTHGYVGRDLSILLHDTYELSEARSISSTITGDTLDSQIKSVIKATTHELNTALRQVRPSAMQEIFFEIPDVRWSDIGGQDEIKRQLHNAVERPLKHAERMAKLCLKPKKGVLLYGPPGCSKTMLVRALARELSVNFLAVKGAELISMYVGESERAIREVFRKARAASPSIIFFDEIESIASSRGSGGGDAGHSSLNVVTTLLTEMDGFEELRGVFVVGATNKPWNIDPALARPGRFDNVVYIGPPDFEARREIFRNRLAKIEYMHSAGVGVGDDACWYLEEDVKDFASATEGFSGAEVVASLEAASEYAFDNDRDYVVAHDVSTAINRTLKQITPEMLQEFETFNARRTW